LENHHDVGVALLLWGPLYWREQYLAQDENKLYFLMKKEPIMHEIKEESAGGHLMIDFIYIMASITGTTVVD
jgi:hypothetical protein